MEEGPIGASPRLPSILHQTLPCHGIKCQSGGPRAREGHIAFKGPSGRMFVFGGTTGTEVLNDLWSMDPSTGYWQRHVCTGTQPPPCCGHTAVCVGKKLVVYGGSKEAATAASVFILDLEVFFWRRVDSVVAHPLRGHSAVVHGTRMFIFGGINSSGQRTNVVEVFDCLAEQWALVGDYNHPEVLMRSATPASLSSFTDDESEVRSPNNNSHRSGGKNRFVVPSPRSGHSAVVYEDVATGEPWMIIFGGRCTVAPSTIKKAKGYITPPEPPPMRKSHPSLGNPHRRANSARRPGSSPRGQPSQTTFSCKTYAYSLRDYQWHHLKTCSTPPSPRAGHSCVIHQGNMLLFGGYSHRPSGFSSSASGLCFSLHLPTLTWRHIDINGPVIPMPRCGHSTTLLAIGGLVFLMIVGGWAEQRPGAAREASRARADMVHTADSELPIVDPLNPITLDDLAETPLQGSAALQRHSLRALMDRTKSPTRSEHVAAPPPAPRHSTTSDVLVVQVLNDEQVLGGYADELCAGAHSVMPLFPQLPHPVRSRNTSPSRSPARSRSTSPYAHAQSHYRSLFSKSPKPRAHKHRERGRERDGDSGSLSTNDETNSSNSEGEGSSFRAKSPRRPVSARERSPGRPAFVGTAGKRVGIPVWRQAAPEQRPLSPREVRSMVTRLGEEGVAQQKVNREKLEAKYLPERSRSPVSRKQVSETLNRVYYTEPVWQAEKQRQLQEKWTEDNEPRLGPVITEDEALDLVDRLAKPKPVPIWQPPPLPPEVVEMKKKIRGYECKCDSSGPRSSNCACCKRK